MLDPAGLPIAREKVDAEQRVSTQRSRVPPP
jgi:hypothetical protein